jgi:uncharacterized protein (DUF952 family)
MIFHITSRAAWDAALGAGIYEADSLKTEGFIHCSTAEQYIWVANQRFRGRTDLVLLHIDEKRLRSEVRYENLEGGENPLPPRLRRDPNRGRAQRRTAAAARGRVVSRLMSIL